MDKSDQIKLTIPPSTIFSVVAVLLGLWLLYQVRDIVFLFLTVVAIVIVFSPLVRSLQRYMPRTLAIILLYILVVFVFLITIALIIPPMLAQLAEFLHFLQVRYAAENFTNTDFGMLRDNLSLISQGKTIQALSQIIDQFKGSFGAFYNSTVGFIGGVVAVVTVFISSFYLLLEEKNFHAFIASLVPPIHQEKVSQITDKISIKMGDWLRGQFILMLIIGVFDGIGLAIIGVPYPLLLGVWAGLTESIPFVGPFIGALPAVLLAFGTLGIAKGLIVVGLYFAVQQIESQFLVPRIMGKALGLSPVIIIFALLIGAKLFGLMGVLVAIPITAALSVVYEEWWKTDR